MAITPKTRKKSPPKERVSISISSEVATKLRKIGEQYGLGLSNMLERAARSYLEDFEDNVIAHYRYTHPEGENISIEDLKKELELED